MSDCKDCQHMHTGPLSGFQYCRAVKFPEWITTHQATQKYGPCGVLRLLFQPVEQRQRDAWVRDYDCAERKSGLG